MNSMTAKKNFAYKNNFKKHTFICEIEENFKLFLGTAFSRPIYKYLNKKIYINH